MGVESIIFTTPQQDVQEIVDDMKADLKVDIDGVKSVVDEIKTDVKEIKEK